MLSKFDVVAKPAHGEEKKSENSEDGGNNSKACEHIKFMWNTGPQDNTMLMALSKSPRQTK